MSAGRHSFYSAVIVFFCGGAIYGGLYESCVRCPRVPFHSWAWPYYAVSLPWGIDRGSICQTDCRLPEQLAERFSPRELDRPETASDQVAREAGFDPVARSERIIRVVAGYGAHQNRVLDGQRKWAELAEPHLPHPTKMAYLDRTCASAVLASAAFLESSAARVAASSAVFTAWAAAFLALSAWAARASACFLTSSAAFLASVARFAALAAALLRSTSSKCVTAVASACA